MIKKIKNSHKSALYYEIDLPNKKEDVCIELKSILLQELKQRNIICYAITIILSIMLTNYLCNKSSYINSFSQIIPYFHSPVYTSLLLIFIFTVTSKLIKHSANFNLYAIESKANERIYFFFAFSRFMSSILSICFYNFFKILRFLLFLNGRLRSQYIFIILLTISSPYFLASKFELFSVAQVLDFNIFLLEFIVLAPVSSVLIVLINSIIFATIFSTLDRIDKLKSMQELNTSCLETFKYYLDRSLNPSDPNYTLLVKGFSSAFGSKALSIFLEFILSHRIKNERLNSFCIQLAKIIILLRNYITIILKNYGNILVFIVEFSLSIFSLIMCRLTITEFLKIKSMPNFDILNLTIYTEFLSLFALLSISFLISNSVFRSMLYKKRIKVCLKIIKNLEVKKSILIAQKESQSAMNPLRKRIGLK